MGNGGTMKSELEQPVIGWDTEIEETGNLNQWDDGRKGKNEVKKGR